MTISTREYPARRDGLHFASVQGEGVIMDLVENRYIALGPLSTFLWDTLQERRRPDLLDADAVRPFVGGDAAIDLPALVARQLDAWRNADLLTASNERSVRERVPVPVITPRATESPDSVDTARIWRSHLSPLMIGRIVHGHWTMGRALKKQGLCSTLRTLQEIRVGQRHDARTREDRLYRVLRAYYSWRRLHAQGREDCVPRSLGLAFTLRTVGIDAFVCFGVRKFPFSAHAWVEAADRIVNDTAQKIRGYALLARF